MRGDDWEEKRARTMQSDEGAQGLVREHVEGGPGRFRRGFEGRVVMELGLFFFFLIYFGCIGSIVAAHGLFSSCGKRGATLCCGARASHCGGFPCCGARALGARASVVVACGLQ